MFKSSSCVMLDYEKKDDARKQKYNKKNKYKNLDIIELIFYF